MPDIATNPALPMSSSYKSIPHRFNFTVLIPLLTGLPCLAVLICISWHALLTWFARGRIDSMVKTK